MSKADLVDLLIAEMVLCSEAGDFYGAGLLDSAVSEIKRLRQEINIKSQRRLTMTTVNDAFEIFYKVSPAERRAAKKEIHPVYNPPDKFELNRPTLVGEFAGTGDDGRPVEVYETRLPASFFTVKVPAHAGKPAYIFSTGSGMGKLAFEMAEAISGNMLDLDEVKND